MAPCATTFRWWARAPPPRARAKRPPRESAARPDAARSPACRARPRLSAADHAHARSSHRYPRVHHGRQPMGGRFQRAPTRGGRSAVLVRGPGRAGRIPPLAGRRPRQWPAAPRTRGPWGASSPTRSRYSRDHERKGQPRPASPAHAQQAQAGQTRRSRRTRTPTGAKDPSAPPPTALPAAAVPPLPISLIGSNKLIHLLCLLVRYPHASPWIWISGP